MPPMEDGAQMGVKTSLVGLNTVEAMKRKQAHKRRGVSGAASSAFLQTPEQFLEALDRTQYVTDVILQPADRSRKRGADYEDRLDYRLQTLGVDKVASNEEEDIGESWHQPVAKLSLEKKVFATLRRQEGKHLYAVDFCTRTYPCKITIECWSMADSSGVRFYVKKGELPTPASFDWWSPGNGKIEIGADDAADQFGKYYITVLAMGSNATYMLTARYAVHRPPVATEHTRAAERMVKDSVKRHISQSSQRAFASRYGRKTMSADHRDKLQPRPRLRGPRDLGVGGQRTTPVTAGFSAHGTSTTTCISQRPASGVSPDPARQELFSDPKISPEAEKVLSHSRLQCSEPLLHDSVFVFTSCRECQDQLIPTAHSCIYMYSYADPAPRKCRNWLQESVTSLRKSSWDERRSHLRLHPAQSRSRQVRLIRQD